MSSVLALQALGGGGGGGGGAGAANLQAAYDAAPSVPQILTQAGLPVTFRDGGSPQGPVFQIQDVAGANIFEVDDTFVEVDGQLRIVDSFINHGAPISLALQDTFTTGGAFIGGGIQSTGTVTYNNSFFIWALLAENKVYQAAVGPGFAAFTLFNALGVIQNLGNFDLVNCLVLNNGMSHRRTTSGTSIVQVNTGLSNSPNTRANVSGAVMTKNVGDTAVRHFITHSTVSGSTINYGTSRGLHYGNPNVALFQSQLGIETAVALIALEVDALPFGGNIVKAAVRSAITNATNSWFLLNNGGALSDFGLGSIQFDDLAGVQFGTSQDILTSWAGAGFYFWQFAATSDQVRWANPSAGVFTMTDENTGAGFFNMDFAKFAWGQLGSVGNGVYVYASKTRATEVNGDWADMNTTDAGNLSIGHAIGQLIKWNVNALAITAGAGSITTAVTHNFGGMTTSGLGGADTFTTRVTGRAGLRAVENYAPLRPAVLTATVNNYAPATGNSQRNLWCLTSDDLGVYNITGIVPQQDNDVITIHNIGTVDNIQLTDLDAGSSAANQFRLPGGATVVIAPHETVKIWYDDVDTKWKIMSIN